MRDNEQENTTDATQNGSTERADEPQVCANCGGEIETEEWHPLVTQTDDDGRFRVYAFCDENCRDKWKDD
jgi:hypothetical protein